MLSVLQKELLLRKKQPIISSGKVRVVRSDGVVQHQSLEKRSPDWLKTNPNNLAYDLLAGTRILVEARSVSEDLFVVQKRDLDLKKQSYALYTDLLSALAAVFSNETPAIVVSTRQGLTYGELYQTAIDYLDNKFASPVVRLQVDQLDDKIQLLTDRLAREEEISQEYTRRNAQLTEKLEEQTVLAQILEVQLQRTQQTYVEKLDEKQRALDRSEVEAMIEQKEAEDAVEILKAYSTELMTELDETRQLAQSKENMLAQETQRCEMQQTTLMQTENELETVQNTMVATQAKLQFYKQRYAECEAEIKERDKQYKRLQLMLYNDIETKDVTTEQGAIFLMEQLRYLQAANETLANQIEAVQQEAAEAERERIQRRQEFLQRAQQTEQQARPT